jgi:hypothetical protein
MPNTARTAPLIDRLRDKVAEDRQITLTVEEMDEVIHAIDAITQERNEVERIAFNLRSELNQERAEHERAAKRQQAERGKR